MVCRAAVRPGERLAVLVGRAGGAAKYSGGGGGGSFVVRAADGSPLAVAGGGGGAGFNGAGGGAALGDTGVALGEAFQHAAQGLGRGADVVRRGVGEGRVAVGLEDRLPPGHRVVQRALAFGQNPQLNLGLAVRRAWNAAARSRSGSPRRRR